MAFFGDDNKLLDPNQAQQAQGSAQQTDDTAQKPLSSDGGDVVSGGANQASSAASSQPSQSSGQQAGTGGQGAGWTNIQAYMNANAGDTGEAQKLQGTIGSQFDSDKRAVTDQASSAKTAAQSQADKKGAAESNASDWVKSAGKAYDWSGNQTKDYSDVTENFRSALNAQYTAPTSYNFGLSDKSQQYGSTLGNDQAFNQFLGDQYQQQAGAPLSTGGRNLQTQLDASNGALNDTRQNLLKQYSGLGQYRDSQVADANSAAQKAQQDFTNHQANLQNYLSGRSSADLNDLANATSAAKTNYNNEYNSGSGQASTLYDGLTDRYNGGNGGIDAAVAGGEIRERRNAGIWGNNLTYNQLQTEQYKQPVSRHNAVEYNSGLANNLAALNKFYDDEDQKYAATGDDSKREWNAIQDILGSTGARQTQGFKVRG